jgi:hypothetical protein
MLIIDIVLAIYIIGGITGWVVIIHDLYIQS